MRSGYDAQEFKADFAENLTKTREICHLLCGCFVRTLASSEFELRTGTGLSVMKNVAEKANSRSFWLFMRRESDRRLAVCSSC
jgi:hypothetical protein